MRRDEVLEKLRAHYAEIEQMGVKSLYLFGSTARDEAKATSDVDLLVDFQPPLNFRKYADLHFFLEELLGYEIDLVTQGGLREEVRPYVEKDTILVA